MSDLNDFNFKTISVFQQKNFRNQNMDGTDLSQKIFQGCDFRGVNLSESNLTGTKFENCLLTDACLCESQLINTSFIDCDLTGMDLADSILKQTFFNHEQIAKLTLKNCAKLENVILRRSHDMAMFSHAPVNITGLDIPIILFDHDALIGNRIHSFEDWMLAENKAFLSKYSIEDLVLSFIRHRRSHQQIQKIS